MHVEPDRQRQRAEALARVLTPMIEAHLRLQPPPAPDPIDAEIMAACGAVGRAVDRLAQVKYTQQEVRARVSLEAAAKRLRSAMGKRGHRNGR